MMSVAGAVAPLVRAAVGREAPVEIRGWDGSRAGPPNAKWAMKINNRSGLRRLLWAPNELGIARAYVSGGPDRPDPAATKQTVANLRSEVCPRRPGSCMTNHRQIRSNCLPR